MQGKRIPSLERTGGPYQLSALLAVFHVHCLVHLAQQLNLEDKFAFLVPLGCLVSFIVLPPDRFAAATARNVAHNVPARGHITLASVTSINIDHGVEQVRFSMLAPEILQFVSEQASGRTLRMKALRILTYFAKNIVVARKVRLAPSATVDAGAVEVRVVRETHGGREMWHEAYRTV